MCGFAGMVGEAPADRSHLDRALDAVRHRGPDSQDTWCRDGVGLAHARLSIIDRAHGSQPMLTRDGRYAVVFNGEIYNHADLRRDLIARGYPLETRCDTEVLPYLYASEGEAMVHRLQGMFAFAIVDLATRDVFVARDRFGKKPVYVAATLDSIVFASTLDATLQLLPERPDVDPQSIASYMVLQCVPGARTPWVGIEKVEPGTWVRWSGGELRRERYWTPPLPSEDRSLDRDEVLLETRAQIRRSVTRRLESEVPLGVFLSGGIDSSVIVAEMAEAGVRAATYSVGFDAGPYDERRWAAMIAERFGTDHHVLSLDADAGALFEQLSWAYDEPFADSSALATLAVARAASEHVTVVLTGDGGDELFGGYDRYRALHRARAIGARLGPLTRPAAAAGRIAGTVSGFERLTMLSTFVADPWEACRNRRLHFAPSEVAALLQPDVAASVDVRAATDELDALWLSLDSTDPWVPWVDARSYLPDDLLTKMDRATMAWGVEARAPLLDHELWEWAATLPRSWLLDAQAGKRLVRDAYRDVLPAPILARGKKGFSVPLTGWLRSHLLDAVGDLLLSERSPVWDLLVPAVVGDVVHRFLDGDDALTYRTWNLLALAAWYTPRRAGAAVVVRS
jgi:asparagine synthase (glutamine-hydrolysing)